MIKKRFTYDFVSVDCPIFYDNKGVIDYDDVVDYLNDFNDKVEYDERVQNEALGLIRNHRKTIDRLNKENEQLKSELDYFKAKNGSLETGMFNLEKENEQLKSELDYWKKRALLLEHKYDEGSAVEWLRNNTVWEQMPSSIPTSFSTDCGKRKVKKSKKKGDVE